MPVEFNVLLKPPTALLPTPRIHARPSKHRSVSTASMEASTALTEASLGRLSLRVGEVAGDPGNSCSAKTTSMAVLRRFTVINCRAY